MKRSQHVTLLCLTTIVAGFLAGCGEEHVNHLRQKRDLNGVLVYDRDGNPIYEDDDRQHYTFYHGSYYPWYTRANGYSTIPGSGVVAPNIGGGVSSESISRSTAVSRGGFGETGAAHASGGFGGGE